MPVSCSSARLDNRFSCACIRPHTSQPHTSQPNQHNLLPAIAQRPALPLGRPPNSASHNHASQTPIQPSMTGGTFAPTPTVAPTPAPGTSVQPTAQPAAATNPAAPTKPAEQSTTKPAGSTGPQVTDSEVPCVICQKPASCKCSLCMNEYYCSRECQIKAWTAHRPVCKKTHA
eukprot:m.576589 g.576589  ORF g.576589 m.576589 type:complete len:173 (-) comp57900_c1_seq10:1192-1710(-)